MKFEQHSLEENKTNKSVELVNCQDLFLNEQKWLQDGPQIIRQISNAVSLSEELTEKLVHSWVFPLNTEESIGSLDDNRKILYDGFQSTFNNIIELQKQTYVSENQEKVGYAEFLYKNFGIVDFGMFPVELLKSQVDNNKDNESKYATIFVSDFDKNKGFYGYFSRFKELQKKLEQEDMRIRVVETSRARDLFTRSLQFQRDYNKENCKLGIVISHAYEDGFLMGSDRKNGWVSMNNLDFYKKYQNQFDGMFEKGAHMVFMGCEIADPRSDFMKSLSKESELIMTGSSQEMNYSRSSIEPLRDDQGNLHFDVKLFSPIDYRKETNYSYQNGQLIKQPPARRVSEALEALSASVSEAFSNLKLNLELLFDKYRT